MATTLLEHRTKLKTNTEAYSHDIRRCFGTIVKHLKDAGYKKITYARAKILIEEYVNLIFVAQDEKPFFHFESSTGLPYCWNSPSKGGWDFNYIRYEWGHLLSLNQNQNTNEVHSIRNLCLQSARCNQHIQSSMNVEELLEYDGVLRKIIEANLQRRHDLFKTQRWRDLENELEDWK